MQFRKTEMQYAEPPSRCIQIKWTVRRVQPLPETENMYVSQEVNSAAAVYIAAATANHLSVWSQTRKFVCKQSLPF